MKGVLIPALCCACLTLGAVFGAHVEALLFGVPVRANQNEGTSADRAYAELRARNTLQEGSELLAKIARLTTHAVVHIQSERRSARRGVVEETGSGVIMESPKARGTYVVTNRHVVDGASLESISIHLHDGRVLHPERVLSDKATDVAVLQITGPNLQPCRWGDSDKADIGHMVLAMGSPFGLSQSITLGIISAKGRRALRLGDNAEVLNQDFLQTDAAINPGNSGGPLIDLQGQVIGINTAIASNSGGNEGIGFSIPSNLARNVMEQLLQYGKVTRAYLGVKLDPAFDVNTARRLKLDRVRGARVLEVYPNTPASRANLQFDDVVLTFDGHEVQDENHLINLVSLTPVDKTRKAKVVVFRQGKHVTLEVQLADRSELEQRAEAPVGPGMGRRVDQLGLTVHDLDQELAAQLGFEANARGLLVLNIDRNGPMAGDLRLYDVIQEVARTPVHSVDDLRQALEQVRADDSLAVKVQRHQNGRTESLVLVVDP